MSGPGKSSSRRNGLQLETAPARRKACIVNISMIIFEGGSRTLLDCEPHRCLRVGQVLFLRPVEECLLSGFPCTLLPFAIRQGSTILCGHSLGVAVALTVAVRLTTCGLCVHGVVALDSRCGQNTRGLCGPSEHLRSLLQSLAPLHFR